MREADREYAEALFALAAEEGISEEILSDLHLVREAFSAEPEYTQLLSTPAIPVSERLSAIEEAFGSRVHEYCVYFLKLLCEKGRMHLLFDCIGEFEKIYLALKGRSTAHITSAVPLTEEQKQRLLEKLEKVTNKKIDPVYSVDPALVGGICVETDGTLYDGTLKRRLRDIKEVMMDEQTR